jgi:exonuclease III
LILQLGDALISYVFRRLNERVRRLRRWRIRVSNCGTQKKKQSRNGIGILIDKSLKNGVVAVRRQGDRIIMIKLIFGDLVLNVISAYTPQVGLSDDVKRRFWEDLEYMVRGVPNSEKLFIGGDLNGHMLAQLEGGLRVYMGVLAMANRIKREKTS